MAQKESNSKISLTGKPKKVISSDVYTLKVPNFFILPEYDDAYFELDSPPFEFANSTWRFQCESRKRGETKRELWIEMFAVYLIRLNSAVPRHIVFYGIVLLDANDEQYSGHNSAQVFNTNCQRTILQTFIKDRPSYDRRNNLTLKIYLISVEALVLNPGDERLMTDKGQETVISDKGVISLSQDFKDVLLNGQDHNLTFNVKGNRFRAHQDILRARSEVFCCMLSHDMIEKNSGVIDVPDCDPVTFEQLLCYIYTGRIEILDENNVFSLYYAADKYHLVPLKEECRDFITNSLTVTNMCSALDLASKHSDASLLESVSTYFFNNLDDILTTAEWELYLKENPTAANELFIKSVKKFRDTKTM